MGLDEFSRQEPNWLAELRERTEDRGFSLCTEHITAKSWYFLIDAGENCAVGKLHHSSDRGNDRYISLDYSDEIGWINDQEDPPFTLDEGQSFVDIFAVVVNHPGAGEYQAETDDFLILTEDILQEEVPPSGQKEFRITESGYRHPFDRHQNSWGRFFENL